MFTVKTTLTWRKREKRSQFFTSFRQLRKKLLSAKSCTGVIECLVLAMNRRASQKRDQERRAGTIDRFESFGGTAANQVHKCLACRSNVFPHEAQV